MSLGRSHPDVDVLTTVGPSNKTASGTLTAAAQTVSLAVEGMETATIVLSGTWVAGVTMEVSADNSTWSAVEYWDADGNEWTSAPKSGNGTAFLNTIGAISHVRARASAYTSGTVNVAVLASSMAAVRKTNDGVDLDTAKNMAVVGGYATSGFDPVALKFAAAAPASDDNGVITRNIPTGDYTVVGKAADGAAVSGNPVLVAGFDGTNVQTLKTDVNGDVQVDVASIAAGDNNIGNVDVVTLPSLPAGTNNIGDVDVLTLPNVTLAAGTNTNEVVGDVAQDVAVAGNPVLVGVRASTAVPTAMSADGDSVYVWGNRSGAPVVTQAPHVGLNSDPWNLVHEAAQYTTTQTSTVLVAGGASEKIVVTKVQIQVGGTTAGTLQLYFGTGAYVRGTNRAIFDGEFAPSSTLKPGVIMDGPFIAGTNGDDLMVTTSAAINPLTISVWFYVVT